jgi:predicted permease
MFHPFSVALAAILSLVVIVCAGIFFRRSGRLPQEAEPALIRLTVDLLMPCLIFDRVLKTDAFSIDPQNLWLPPLLGFSFVAIGIFIGLCIAFLPPRHNGLATWKQRRTFAACVGNYNYGYLPIPLVIAMFPEDARVLGVLFVQNLGVEIAMWTIVLFTFMGTIDRKSFRHLINAPSIAIVLSVSLNLLGNSRFVPTAFHEHGAPCFDFLLQAIHLLGAAGIPLAIILIGAIFAEHFHREAMKRRLQATLKISFWSILIRLVMMPVIFILFALGLPCTLEIKQVIIIHGATGSAIFPMALAKHYGGDPKTAFDTIVSNSLLSVLTLPIWIAIGLRLIS